MWKKTRALLESSMVIRKCMQNISSYRILGHFKALDRIGKFGSCGGSVKNIRYINRTNQANKMATTLNNLKFDNLALRSLPLDTSQVKSSRQVPGACFSLVQPTPVENPCVVAYSPDAISLLGLADETEAERPEFAEYFSGNQILTGSQTAAHCYCGHQFGSFAGQLGDGAAIYLGEVLNEKGERWEIQLKGAGLTPYSRTADGRKVLRSSIREFLCSEAMHYLGIPTTRAGSCVTSDTVVIRDMFYDGRPRKEGATIVLRIAPTFIRFGSFEIFKPVDRMTGRQGPSVGRTDILTKLIDYTIDTFYPEIKEAEGDNTENCYLQFYHEVVLRTARLVAQWQCIGFCHGVLNTDNMSIIGVTIDYGPFGFLDHYDPDHICNASDEHGRYSYKKQPEICKWNLLKLAEAIQGVLPLEKSKKVLDEVYDEEFVKCYKTKMREKLGLLNKELQEDQELVESLLETMHQTGGDFTNIFRMLCKVSIPGATQVMSDEELMDDILNQCQTPEEMLKLCQPSVEARQLQMLMMLFQSNPSLLSQLGGGAALIQRELSRIEKSKQLQDLKPEEKMEKDKELWNKWLNDYRKRLQLEVDGPEQNRDEFNDKRVKMMKAVNPRFILRNYIAQDAIDKAEKGDYSEVRRILKILQSPFSDECDMSFVEDSSSSSNSEPHVIYDRRPPDWALDLRVT